MHVNDWYYNVKYYIKIRIKNASLLLTKAKTTLLSGQVNWQLRVISHPLFRGRLVSFIRLKSAVEVISEQID